MTKDWECPLYSLWLDCRSVCSYRMEAPMRTKQFPNHLSPFAPTTLASAFAACAAVGFLFGAALCGYQTCLASDGTYARCPWWLSLLDIYRARPIKNEFSLKCRNRCQEWLHTWSLWEIVQYYLRTAITLKHRKLYSYTDMYYTTSEAKYRYVSHPGLKIVFPTKRPFEYFQILFQTVPVL